MGRRTFGEGGGGTDGRVPFVNIGEVFVNMARVAAKWLRNGCKTVPRIKTSCVRVNNGPAGAGASSHKDGLFWAPRNEKSKFAK